VLHRGGPRARSAPPSRGGATFQPVRRSWGYRHGLLSLRVAIGAWLLVLLAACFTANTPSDSTQTGNPPFIDSKLVELVVSADGAKVVGKPGAVPGGANVEVINLRTGQVTRMRAAEDGSFDVPVESEPDDTFSVTARKGQAVSETVYVNLGSAAVGGTPDSCEDRATAADVMLEQVAANADRACEDASDCVSVRVSTACGSPSCELAYVTRRGRDEIESAKSDIEDQLCASKEAPACESESPDCAEPKPAVCTLGQCAGEGDRVTPNGPSCVEVQLQADTSRASAYRIAPRACSSDDECALPPEIELTCLPKCDYPLAYSLSGRDQLALALAQIEGEYCSGYEAMQCTESVVQCDPVDLEYGAEVACVASQCERLPKVWSKPADCVTCVEQAIQWSYMTGLEQNFDISRLQPCAHYSRRREGGFDPNVRLACATELAACDGASSTQAVLAALAHPDVVAVLEGEEVEVQFGHMRGRNLNEPPNPVEVGVQVVLGFEPEARFLSVYGSCEGGPADCVPPPPGVEALRDLLLELDRAQEAGPCAEFAP
jgi:hypothetical protein